jgi:hypothetical protein
MPYADEKLAKKARLESDKKNREAQQKLAESLGYPNKNQLLNAAARGEIMLVVISPDDTPETATLKALEALQKF